MRFYSPTRRNGTLWNLVRGCGRPQTTPKLYWKNPKPFRSFRLLGKNIQLVQLAASRTAHAGAWGRKGHASRFACTKEQISSCRINMPGLSYYSFYNRAISHHDFGVKCRVAKQKTFCQCDKELKKVETSACSKNLHVLLFLEILEKTWEQTERTARQALRQTKSATLCQKFDFDIHMAKRWEARSSLRQPIVF